METRAPRGAERAKSGAAPRAAAALLVTGALLLPLTGPADARPALTSRAPSRAMGAPALSAGNDVVDSPEKRLMELDAQEGSLKGELGGLGGAIADAHARTIAHAKAFYRLTRAGLLPVGGGFDELVRHALRVERARRALGSDVANEKHLRARGGEIARELDRIGRDRGALAVERAALEQAKVAAEAENRRQDAFDRAFETSTGPSGDYVAIYGGSGSASASAEGNASGFAAQRGRLAFPVAGRAEVRPARREGADGPGLEVRAPLGSAVRAVFAGRVAFADRYGPYGRIVILDHGDHYYTVSGNLAAFDVKVGDEVSAGERIGTVGDDGHGPMLYFEVRHGTDTVAPGAWLGL